MQAKAAKFLDSNAGAPLRPEVVTALSCLFNSPDSLIANPSSIHSFWRKSKRMVAEARESVARSLGLSTDPEQLIFTSSGTEANQLAIRSVLEPLLNAGARPHWITTPVEHDSVLQMVEWLKSRGGSTSFISLDSAGRPDPASLSSIIQKDTALVSLIWVNNETGVISDVAAISAIARNCGIKFHVDAAQAWGKIPVDVNSLGADFVSFSGHKIGGLAGTGLLWVGRGTSVRPVLFGKQEKGRRGGTENVLGIVSLGAAASAIDVNNWSQKLQPLREYLESAICSQITGTQLNGRGAPRVPNTSNLSFEGVEGEGLVLALDLAGYAVSAGSACSSGALEPSHVLLAMGRPRAQAMASIRVSLTENLTHGDLDAFVGVLASVMSRIRQNRALKENFSEASI